MQEIVDTKPKRSIGELRMVEKTNPRAPKLKGKLRLQGHTFRELAKQLEDSEADPIICCIAGWFNGNEDDEFITVELSPDYVSNRKEPKNISSWVLRD